MSKTTTEIDSGDSTHQFLKLLGACEGSLRAYILALVPNWIDADEIAQETRIRLWEQFQAYDPSKDFGAWARRIAHYQILTHRKRSHRAAARFSDRFVELVADEASRMADDFDARRVALQQCVIQLSPAHRELIWACYSGSETIKSVARRANRSIRGMQRTVARIRAMLQDCIERAIRREETA